MTSTDLTVIPRTPAQIAAESNLRSFKPGYDARRFPNPTSTKKRGRPSPLDDPEFLELFSEALANGLTAPELAELFEMGERTMRDYKKDPRVKAAALKFIEDRVIRVCRKIDNVIENRLLHPEEMDVTELLKIRKEYLGGVLRQQTQGSKDDQDVIHEAIEVIENNPEFAAEFEALIRGKIAGEAA